ncbi:uncharacterized protein LOC101238613 [Trichonephila clavipes]|nr:uncharacterized protein LOC101238613 [Trichonephila clavipes]
MEVVGAYRIFERSNVRNVQYNEYYGDGDSKGYESVKNCNESYNILWNIVPKNIFIGLETFRLGALLALILYNSGYAGILSVIRNVNGSLPESVAQELLKFDKQRISTSLRHSLPIAKLSRKKRKAARKTKSTKDEKNRRLSIFIWRVLKYFFAGFLF